MKQSQEKQVTLTWTLSAKDRHVEELGETQRIEVDLDASSVTPRNSGPACCASDIVQGTVPVNSLHNLFTFAPTPAPKWHGSGMGKTPPQARQMAKSVKTSR